MANVLVILDTNALFDDPVLERPMVGKLLALARRGLVAVAIPRVVVMELERQRRATIHNKLEQLKSAPKKIESALEALGVTSEEVGVSSPGSPTMTFEELLDRYNERVAKTLDASAIEVLPIPPVSHEDLLRRDLVSKKPFDSAGKGNRDALIWESVLRRYANIGHEDEVFFVTNDDNFGAGDDLDSALAKELPQEVGAAFTRVRSLEELLEVESMQEQRLIVQQAIEAMDRYGASELAEEAVESYVENSLSGTQVGDHTRDALNLPPEIEDLEIDEAATMGNFAWSLYDEFDGTTVLGEGSLDTELVFRGFVEKANSAVLADAELRVEGWEDDRATVLVSKEARALFDVRVEVTGESVEDVTFLGLEPN